MNTQYTFGLVDIHSLFSVYMAAIYSPDSHGDHETAMQQGVAIIASFSGPAQLSVTCSTYWK